MPPNVLTVNNWKNVMKDELEAIETLMWEAFDKALDLQSLEDEIQDLSVVFFCKYGKFPDEV
jgi:hypothetical protein